MFPLLAVASTAAFLCAHPTHHDGDGIRCGGKGRSMRLYAIDAPEMPGSCRPGRQCTPGDPYASRDHLAELTAGRKVLCEAVDRDHYGRTIARCTADGADLSCAMVRDGFAVERYGRLSCGEMPAPAEPPPAAPPALRWWMVPAYFLVINLMAYIAFRDDKRRARRGAFRRSEANLLWLAALGGSPGALVARQRFRHKTRKQPFSALLATIVIVQVGVIAGLGWRAIERLLA